MTQEKLEAELERIADSPAGPISLHLFAALVARALLVLLRRGS